jgi:hypothetical protein
MKIVCLCPVQNGKEGKGEDRIEEGEIDPVPIIE